MSDEAVTWTARNIAQSVWLELCYDDGAFETSKIERSD
jgi:hypothetical protein